jgi:hypothetical protein
MEQVVQQIKAFVKSRGFSTTKASDISWREDFFVYYEGKLVMCIGVEAHTQEGWACIASSLCNGVYVVATPGLSSNSRCRKHY